MGVSDLNQSKSGFSPTAMQVERPERAQRRKYTMPEGRELPPVAWLLWAAVFGLMVIGALAIFSATNGNTDTTVSQLTWYAVGLTAAAVLCFWNYQRLAQWALVGYWMMILVLLAVLVPGIGAMRYGARRWLDFGVFQVQPSEFAKLALIFALAYFLSRPTQELRSPKAFFKGLALTLLPFLLILREPDLGSALVMIPIGLVMMFVGKIPIRYLARLVGWTGLVITVMVVNVLFAPPAWRIELEDYQRRRLMVYFGVDYAPRDATPEEKRQARIQQRNDSYNVRQALISVGSGGIFGKGWRQGTQNSLGYLPRDVAHNDFIFSVIAEEKGFVGSVTVLALYSIVLLCGVHIAYQARDRLGRLLAVGVVTLWFSQIFINIGMNIRLMPVTGLPLPLLSYGGSSVISALIAIGILQNIYWYRRT